MLQCGHRMPSLFFDSLTEKQAPGLYVWLHGTAPPRQIANALSLAPVTIDKRIESVRSRLGAIPRADLFCVSMVSGVMLMIEPYAIQSY